MKEKKVSYKTFMAWEYDKEEAYLNRLSKEGWQVEAGGCFHTKLAKDDSVVYRYRLDFNPDAMKNREEKQRYIETFADDGWEFINETYNGWIYLRKEEKPGMTEEDFFIYSDRESLMELVKRFMRMIYGLFVLIVIAFAGNLAAAVGGKSLPNLIFAVIMAFLFFGMLRGLFQLKEKQEQLAAQIR